MGTRRYRQHSAADKVAILRQVLLEGQAVSAVCEEHDLSPTLFYTWQIQESRIAVSLHGQPPSLPPTRVRRGLDWQGEGKWTKNEGRPIRSGTG
jgi:transposase-like protein